MKSGEIGTVFGTVAVVVKDGFATFSIGGGRSVMGKYTGSLDSAGKPNLGRRFDF
jgi:hypothetical protein